MFLSVSTLLSQPKQKKALAVVMLLQQPGRFAYVSPVNHNVQRSLQLKRTDWTWSIVSFDGVECLNSRNNTLNCHKQISGLWSLEPARQYPWLSSGYVNSSKSLDIDCVSGLVEIRMADVTQSQSQQLRDPNNFFRP